MRLLSEDPHLLVAFLESVNLACHLILHGLEHLFLSPLSSLSVDFLALLVAGFSELAVVDDYILALLGPPFLVDEFLLLLRLPLHALKNLILAFLVLHVLVGLHLVDDHLPATSFAFLAVSIAYNFLIL